MVEDEGPSNPEPYAVMIFAILALKDKGKQLTFDPHLLLA